MKRNRAQMLGDILRQYLRQEGLETPLNERRIIDAWPDVMGAAISGYTGMMYIRNQVLFVQLKSPALRANLMMNRQSIVQRLNEAVGAQVIQGIEFR